MFKPTARASCTLIVVIVLASLMVAPAFAAENYGTGDQERTGGIEPAQNQVRSGDTSGTQQRSGDRDGEPDQTRTRQQDRDGFGTAEQAGQGVAVQVQQRAEMRSAAESGTPDPQRVATALRQGDPKGAANRVMQWLRQTFTALESLF